MVFSLCFGAENLLKQKIHQVMREIFLLLVNQLCLFLLS